MFWLWLLISIIVCSISGFITGVIFDYMFSTKVLKIWGASLGVIAGIWMFSIPKEKDEDNGN